MWDPEKYLAFDDHRSRAFFDLLNRVAAEQPRRVVDLGCGPGHLTLALAQRWPGAVIEASDSSPDMVAAARDRGVDATLGAVEEWHPAPDTDVVICNAVLQWVPTHTTLLPRWVDRMPSGAWLAFQVPGNFDAPSHRTIRELASRDQWRAELAPSGILEPERCSTQMDTPDYSHVVRWTHGRPPTSSAWRVKTPYWNGSPELPYVPFAMCSTTPTGKNSPHNSPHSCGRNTRVTPTAPPGCLSAECSSSAVRPGRHRTVWRRRHSVACRRLLVIGLPMDTSRTWRPTPYRWRCHVA